MKNVMTYDVDSLIGSFIDKENKDIYKFRKSVLGAYNQNKVDLIEDESRNESNVFIEFNRLHKDEWMDIINEERIYMIEHLPELNGRKMMKNEFFTLYNDFMEKNTYNFSTEKRKMVYAISIRVLYPNCIREEKTESSFIASLIEEFAYTTADLPYLVYNEHRGKAKYAVILLIEREFEKKEEWQKYKKDLVIDIRTGCWASRNCPNDYKKVIAKKGDYKKDKDGNRIPVMASFSRCQRIFRWADGTKAGRDTFNEFIMILKRKVINACIRVSRKKPFKGKVLPKRICKKEYNNFAKRRLAMMNFAKSTIQKTTNVILSYEYRYCQHLEPYNQAKNTVFIKTKAYKEVESVFEKYRTRFNKKEFHDNNDEVRKIDPFHQRVDQFEHNIYLLLQMFFTEINQIELSQ